jgi:hypothetical protein
MKITTKSGFKFDLDERILEDWRVISAMKKADDRDKPEDMIEGITDLVSLIFGKDEDRLVDFIAERNEGYVPVDYLKDELLSVFTRAKSLKNSSTSQA